MINPNYSKFPEIEPINEKTMKQDKYLRNSDTFKKTLNKEFKDEKIVIKKPSIHKKNSSDKTNILTNVNTLCANKASVIVQGSNVSPIKMIRQVSSLTNNNLTTNYTEIVKDGLTIKTNTIEQSGDMAFTIQSPSNNNIKTITNNLKTISSKISPKAYQNKKLNNNVNPFDKAIKIVQYNDENAKDKIDLNNLNILNSIHQFGQILKNTNHVGNSIFSTENLKKINELNEVLKALSSENKDNPTVAIAKNEIQDLTNSNNQNIKAIKNQKTFFSSQPSNVLKKNQKNIKSLIMSPQIASNEIRLSKENDECNLSGFSEQKINSANNKDRIISEIYKNSDGRIKRYGVLFEFITNNITEIKNLIIFNSNKQREHFEDIDDRNIHYNLNAIGHIKKISSTSNEIDKFARKVNEDNINLMFSSLSILNSTLKKQKDDSEKIINLSKNPPLDNSENCHDSDLEEYVDIDERVEIYQAKKNLKVNNKVINKKIEKKSKRKNDLNLINGSLSFIISSINSDFYKDLINESFCECSKSISVEMSDLKGDIMINDLVDQSMIHEKNKDIKVLNASLDRTMENVNLFEKKVLPIPQNVKRDTDFQNKFMIVINTIIYSQV